MESDIASDTGGYLRKIMRSIASGGRPDSDYYYDYDPVNYDLAESEAEELYDAGKGQLIGTDESVFIRILCSRSFSQLNATFDAYYKISNTDIEKSIKSEMSGDLEFACLTISNFLSFSLINTKILRFISIIVKSARNKPAYFAEQIHNAMKGLGTKDDDLIRLLVSRAEVKRLFKF